jgi:hypothetical protein
MSDHVYNLFLTENTVTSTVYLDIQVNLVFTQQQRTIAVFSNRVVHLQILITLYAELLVPSFLVTELESKDQFHDQHEVLIYLQWISSAVVVSSISSAGKPDKCSGLTMKNYRVKCYCVAHYIFLD